MHIYTQPADLFLLQSLWTAMPPAAHQGLPWELLRSALVPNARHPQNFGLELALTGQYYLHRHLKVSGFRISFKDAECISSWRLLLHVCLCSTRKNYRCDQGLAGWPGRWAGDWHISLTGSWGPAAFLAVRSVRPRLFRCKTAPPGARLFRRTANIKLETLVVCSGYLNSWADLTWHNLFFLVVH